MHSYKQFCSTQLAQVLAVHLISGGILYERCILYANFYGSHSRAQCEIMLSIGSSTKRQGSSNCFAIAKRSEQSQL